MNLRIGTRDLILIRFLGRYKKIKAIDCKKIYKSKDYYLKRLKALEKARYIRRENRYYIKIDIEGRKLLNDLGYYNYNICRNKDYQERIKNITKIAMLTLDSDIEFIPSWELKENQIYTDSGRKYIGELKYMRKKYIVYYISYRNEPIYAKQIVTDINKMFSYDDVIVFLEDFSLLNKRNKYFMFGKESVELIIPSEENLEMMKLLENIDCYDILKSIYKDNEILLSNWDKADYKLDNGLYIVFMPFINTEKLHALNIFYGEDKKQEREIVILTLQENIKKINEILVKKTNIVAIDEVIENITNIEISEEYEFA